MNCILCNRPIKTPLKFYELFLLKSRENTLCRTCQANFVKISEEHCPRCHKSGSNEVCSDCKIWESKGVIVNHRAVFNYNSAMQEFFSNYKFLGDYRLHKVFDHYFKFDKSATVVPIPLSPERYQTRGFNQVTAFLENTKYEEILIKFDTKKQSSLTRTERLTTENPFSIAENTKIPEKVIIVDDIYTTGATLQHAVKTLKIAGAKEIQTFSLCR
jgi:competence protein ComFC